MPFPMPPTNSITVPTGATSGARIVIDGTTDTITVYDANNVPVITLTASLPNIGGFTGPGFTFDPDTSPAPSPWTQLGYLVARYNAGLTIGSLTLAAPSLDPATNAQGELFLDSGTAAGGGLDSHAQLVTGSGGEVALVGGTVRLDPLTDPYPIAGAFGNTHNIAIGEWTTVNVTVTAGTSSGTATLNFAKLYSTPPKLIGFINSGSGNAIRATVFCSAKGNTQATIRVDTNANIGSTTTFPVDVLVLV